MAMLRLINRSYKLLRRAVTSVAAPVNPVTFDSSGISTTEDGTMCSAPITVASHSNGALFIFICATDAPDSSSSPSIRSVQINNFFAATLIGNFEYDPIANSRLWVYKYLNPSAGALTVDVTMQDIADIIVGAVSLYNVNQTVTNGSLQTNTGTSVTPQISVNGTISSSMLLNMAGTSSGGVNLSVNSNQTLVQSTAVDYIRAAIGRTTGGGTLNPKWTSTTSTTWGVGAVEVFKA